MRLLASVSYDREWWMTVVVAGLVVSVAAAYVKDGLSSLLKKIISLATVERRRRRRDRARTIIFLSYNPTLLLVKLTAASSGLNRIMNLFLLTTLLPIFAHTMRLHPEWTFGFRPIGGFDPMLYFKWCAGLVLPLIILLVYSYLDDESIATKAAWRAANIKCRTNRERTPPTQRGSS